MTIDIEDRHKAAQPPEKENLKKPKKPFSLNSNKILESKHLKKNNTHTPFTKKEKDFFSSLDDLSRKEALEKSKNLKSNSSENNSLAIPLSSESPKNFIKPDSKQDLSLSPCQNLSSASLHLTSELLDKLSTRLIQELNNGISTTTLSITDSKSKLFGTHIEIKHFDTAPHSFHLSIETTDIIKKEIETHLAFLHQGLQQALPQCVFHISPPTYENIKFNSKSQYSCKSIDKKKELSSRKNRSINPLSELF